MGVAKIENGIVTQVDRTRGFPLAGEVACTDDVAPGMYFLNGKFSAPEPDADPRALILAQITALEARVTPRRAREAILTDEGHDWLANIDAEIEALRGLL